MKKQEIIEHVNRMYFSCYESYLEAVHDSYLYRTIDDEAAGRPDGSYAARHRTLHLVLYMMELHFRLILNSDVHMSTYNCELIEKQLSRRRDSAPEAA